MGPDISLRIGLPEAIILLGLLGFMLWGFRAWVLEAAEAARAHHDGLLERAASSRLAEMRAEIDRMVHEASDRIAGSKRGALAKVYQAVRHADLVVGQTFAPRDPLRFERFSRMEFERLMVAEGLPTRTREEILDTFMRDRENGTLALDRYLAQMELDRAGQAVDEARAAALLHEFYLSDGGATLLRTEIGAMARQVTELRRPDLADERRAQLLQQFTAHVERAGEILRDAAA